MVQTIILLWTTFTLPLLRLLKEIRIAVTETVQINYLEKAPLKFVKEMEKLQRDSSHVATESKISKTFANSFPVPRMSVKVSSHVCCDDKSHWIGKGNQQSC